MSILYIRESSIITLGVLGGRDAVKLESKGGSHYIHINVCIILKQIIMKRNGREGYIYVGKGGMIGLC
jgi:hypothetical protein